MSLTTINCADLLLQKQIIRKINRGNSVTTLMSYIYHNSRIYLRAKIIFSHNTKFPKLKNRQMRLVDLYLSIFLKLCTLIVLIMFLMYILMLVSYCHKACIFIEKIFLLGTCKSQGCIVFKSYISSIIFQKAWKEL